jgi:stress response protein SCP2
MAINLQKGQRISLTKEAPGLKKIICGLGWDVVEQTGGGLFGAFSNRPNYDLDASVICLGSNGKVGDKDDIVYFGNLKHRSGGITHLGDNLTGAGEGDDEQIIVDLSLVPHFSQRKRMECLKALPSIDLNPILAQLPQRQCVVRM